MRVVDAGVGARIVAVAAIADAVDDALSVSVFSIWDRRLGR